jgi:hypothetical protein
VNTPRTPSAHSPNVRPSSKQLCVVVVVVVVVCVVFVVVDVVCFS